MDKTEGFQCLEHSIWTICTLLSQFYFPNFATFSLLYWEANSYCSRGLIMRKGISPNFQYGLDRVVSVPGAFNLDHLQPFKPSLRSRPSTIRMVSASPVPRWRSALSLSQIHSAIATATATRRPRTTTCPSFHCTNLRNLESRLKSEDVVTTFIGTRDSRC